MPTALKIGVGDLIECRIAGVRHMTHVHKLSGDTVTTPDGACQRESVVRVVWTAAELAAQVVASRESLSRSGPRR